VRTAVFRAGLGDLERLRLLDDAGIDRQLLSPWTDLTAYALDAGRGEAFARRYNDVLAEEVERRADRFAAYCTVPLQDPEAAAVELRRAVRELGMVGAAIATTVGERELDDRSLEPFWTAAEELRALVLVHPLRPLAGRGISRYRLGNLVGNPAETTVAAAHLVFGGVLERHPDLRVLLVHGGGFLPYQAGRLDRGFAAQPELTADALDRPPGESLRRLYYDTVLHSAEAVAFLVRFAGAGHVLLGSDMPFAMGEPEPLAGLAELGAADADAVGGGSVERLLAEIRR
jgi:aminocarboxymuconate-semialdehyde decarboxylase